MKKIMKLLPVLILVLALIGGVFLVKQVQETRRGAAGDDLDLTLVPDKLELNIGDEKDVVVYMAIGKLQSPFANVKLNYPSDILEVVSVDLATSGNNNEFQLGVEQNEIPLSGVFGDEIRLVLRSMANLPTGDAIKLGTIRVKAIANGSGNINFIPGEQRVTDLASANYIAEDSLMSLPVVVGSGDNGTGYCATLPLRIETSVNNYNVGDEFDANIILDAGDNKITLGNFIFSYDDALLELVASESGPNSPFLSILNSGDEIIGNNKYKMVAVDVSGSAGNINFGKLHFRVKAVGTTAINFESSEYYEIGGTDASDANCQFDVNFSSSNISLADAPTDVPECTNGDRDCHVSMNRPRLCQNGSWVNQSMCSSGQVCENGYCEDLVATATNTPTNTQPVATNTPVPTATEVPFAGTPVLNFSVTFTGVLNASNVKRMPKVLVKVKQGYNQIAEFAGVQLQAGDGANFIGSVVLSGVQPGSGYSVLIKGPQHLARKFCEDSQTERCSGAGNINLVAGENNYNFSKLSLEPGDLPNPSYNMAQDGVANGIDMSMLKARFFQTGLGELLVADVDFNNVINSRDLVLVLQTLSTKYGEEE